MTAVHRVPGLRRRAGSLARSSLELRLLVAAKLLDAATTALGLLFVPLVVEANPFLRALMVQVGVLPGLALGTAAVVGAVALVTEGGVLACRRRGLHDDWVGVTVRSVGYGPLSLVFAAAGLHNLRLVLTVLGA